MNLKSGELEELVKVKAQSSGTISMISSKVTSRAVQIFSSVSVRTFSPRFILARVTMLTPELSHNVVLLMLRSIKSIHSFLYEMLMIGKSSFCELSLRKI